MAVRISVSHLIHSMSFQDRANAPIHYPALLNKKGDKVSAIGGAVKLTEFGKKVVSSSFQARDFEEGEKADDMRFFVPKIETADEVLSWTRKLKMDVFFESSPNREVGEELKKVAGLEGEDLEKFHYESLGWHLQPFDDSKPFYRADDPERENPYPYLQRRLFHLWKMLVPGGNIPPKLFNSLRFLTPDELKTTNGGRCQGLTAKGLIIADNLGIITP